jgi:hypothetical protein
MQREDNLNRQWTRAEISVFAFDQVLEETDQTVYIEEQMARQLCSARKHTLFHCLGLYSPAVRSWQDHNATFLDKEAIQSNVHRMKRCDTDLRWMNPHLEK